MKLKITDAVLIAGIVLGGVLAWRTGAVRSRLGARYARLVQVTGDLTITDPTKLYFLGLDTGDPTHFAWRVHLPPNYSQELSHKSWNGGGNTSLRNDEDFIARIRFREEDGVLYLFTSTGSSKSRQSLGDAELARLVRGRWDQIRVVQVGRDRLETLDAKRPAVLLRLELPPELWETVKDKNSGQTPVFFELRLGKNP